MIALLRLIKQKQSASNNVVNISGTIDKIGDIYSVNGVEYNLITIKVSRASKNADYLLAYIPSNIAIENENKDCQYTIGDRISITGALRSKKRDHVQYKNNRVNILVSSARIEKTTDDSSEKVNDINDISLTGYVCKFPIHRCTSKGRLVSNVILKVYRNQLKTNADYIPIIFWESCTEIVKQLTVGNIINVSGKLQSRDFYSSKENETLTCHEVSGHKITILQEDVAQESGDGSNVG